MLMMHEIEPHVFDNQMRFAVAQPHDTVLSYTPYGAGDPNYAVVAAPQEGASLRLPTRADYPEHAKFVYLFSIDDQRFFLMRREKSDAREPVDDPPGYGRVRIRELRPYGSDTQAFAAMTGFHLHIWYRDNVRCGRCGKTLAYSHDERALECRSCGLTVYPRINPVVIVAVADGDRLLLTRYAHGGYKSWACVAGFVEFGETAEQAVAREVFEECGVRVRNVRYAASQPWGMSGSLMLGFAADLDGDPAITLQVSELSEAAWVPRDEIDDTGDYVLGQDLIRRFKYRKWPFSEG